ncbi:hypothetical protein GOP47_0011929 [Adiantum capillus-veneris]|uniref:Uncharacterized protein n=1 Tax=Adiantum capillus-veneris TaxID=13818 RepID=A0A9D4ZI95_ADICA|nr:hypothetical protein GOP47_0011929 [Adiantum capillus-veneris]
MAPLKDTFGEASDAVTDALNEGCLKEDETTFLEANSDTIGRFRGEKNAMTEAHHEDESNMLKISSIQSSKAQNLDMCTEGSLLVEKILRVGEVIDRKCNLKRQSLEVGVFEETGDDLEHSMYNDQQMKSSMLSLKDKATLDERSELDGPRARGRGIGNSLMKRVMSEASFMQGQVMVRKNECVQEVISKRKGSKEMAGAEGSWDSQIKTDEGKSEENLVEVEVTLRNWSNVEQMATMEGEEMLIVWLSPRSSTKSTAWGRNSAADQPLPSIEMNPESLGTIANFKSGNLHHQQALEIIQHSSKKPIETTHLVPSPPLPAASRQAHTKPGVSSALNGIGTHVERARPASIITPQSRTPGIADKPVKTFEELHKPKVQTSMTPSKAKEVAQGQVKTSEAASPLPRRNQRVGRMPENAGLLEVKEVACECCGMGEECTTGYVKHVKDIFSGHWVCGLCAEAVHEERHRLGKGVPMEDAVRTHMNLCKQFSSSMKKAAGGPPDSPGVAHAVCHLLSRHLSDPVSPRQVLTTAMDRPALARSTSCRPAFSHKSPCSSRRS